MWFTEQGRQQIGRIDPRTHRITEYSTGWQSYAIAAGPGKTMWSTDQVSDTIHRLDPSGHDAANYPLPAARSTPGEITLGPDGAMWFTEFGKDCLGRLDLLDHRIAEYRTPSPISSPEGITLAEDGALWFTEFGTNQIARLDPSALTPRETTGQAREPYRLLPSPAARAGGVRAQADQWSDAPSLQTVPEDSRDAPDGSGPVRGRRLRTPVPGLLRHA